MKILILTAIPFWHPGTQELINHLRNKGVDVEALDIFSGKKLNSKNEIIELINLPLFLRRVYLKLFRRQFTKKHTKHADIIDIHFVEAIYSKYVLDLPQKMICTLFGSDLFRTNEEQKQLQKPLFNRADKVLLSTNMMPYFEEHFGKMAEKYLLNQYGSARLDLISETDRESIQDNFNFPENKKIVTCGYNAKKEQQHIKVINAVETMSDDDLDKMHFVFPLTYGKTEAYLSELKDRLSSSKLSYSLLEDRLNDDDLVAFRHLSDITINTQTTDALASSLKEAMVANDIMLIGNWLPYSIYEDMGIYFQQLSFDSLPSVLKNSLDNFVDLRLKSTANATKIMEFASWSVLIDNWIKSYETLNNGRKQ